MTTPKNKLLRKLLLLSAQLMAFGIFAQAPSLINYQGAARLASGTPLDNRTISIKFDIHQGTSSGSIVATETQTVQTNLLGLFTTQIGKGVNLGTINWQANAMFLQVSMDTSSGSNFTSLGTQQMVSVPYAMYANSVSSSYTNNILTIGNSTYALSPTLAVTPNTTITVSGLGTVTSAGTNSFDLNIPAPTFTNTGQTIISGSYPNYTVNTPTVPVASVPTIAITNTAASTSTVTSSGNSFSINVPPPTFTNAGPATITGAYPNFTINSSAGTTYTNGAGISITSGSVIGNTSPNITPTVAITTTAAAGASVTSAGSSFSINVPAPTFTNAGPATITGAYPNYTINSSTGVTYTNGAGISITSGTIINTAPHITSSLAITATAAAGPSVTSSGNSFSLNVPPPTFTNAGPSTITGAYPNFTINSATGVTYTNGVGISITSGSIINNTSPNQTVVLSNGGNVNITGTYPSFTLATPTAPSYTSGAGISITSGSIINTAPNITPTVAITTTAAAVAAVSSAGSSYNINVPPPTFTNAGPATISGTYPNYTINSTAAINPTINGAGIAVVSPTTGNNFLVTVNQPTFAYSDVTGSLTSGTSSAYIAPALALNGTTLTSGPASNSLNLSSLSPWVATTGTVALTTTSNMVGIGTSSPAYKLDILGTGGPRFRVFSQDGFYAGLLAKNNTHEFFIGIQADFESAGGVTSGFHIYDNTAGARRMVIDATGKMGVANSAPTEILDVTGNIRFSGALMPNNLPGTSGQYLVSAGAGAPPVWAALGTGTATAWSTLGNVGTSTVSNFIGTTDNVDLNFRVGNVRSGRIEFATNSVFFGFQSGPATNTTTANTGIGYSALNGLTSGTGNTGIGYLSLLSNNSGIWNTAVGGASQLSNTTGGSNTSLGYQSLRANTLGSNNIAIGRDALLINNNATGGNIVIGAFAGVSNTSGSNNTMLGTQSGGNNISGSGNVFLGYNAGFNETTSNKFYLANSNTATAPLMYGDFTTGNLAIGTVNANANLQFSNAVVGRKIVLQEAANNDNQVYGFGLSANTLRYQVDASTANHIFYSGINTTTSQELVRIMGIRRVGINTAAPTATFEVTGTTKLTDGTQGLGKILTSDALGNASWATSPDWSQTGNAGTAPATNFIGTTDAQAFRIRTNNIERISVTSAGNVGIGTNAPLVLLAIDNQSVTARDGLNILNGRDAVGSGMPFQVFATTTGQIFGTNTFGRIMRLNNSTLGFVDHGIDQAGSYFISRSGVYNPSADFVITATGNIGIGTSNPNGLLQLDNSIVNRKIVLFETANNDHQIYSFGINNNVLRYQVDGTGSDHVFFAGTSSSTSNELMRIKGSGYVGIGTNAPGFRFEVAPGTVSISDDQGHSTFYHASGNGGAIRAESNTTGNSAGSSPYAQAYLAGYEGNSPVASNIGVWGNATGNGANGWGVVATHGTVGAEDKYAAFAGPSYAGYFLGSVAVVGAMSKSSGTFKIDHPQDPANKFLYHSFVESPDMMNVYNGNVVTDANGDAVVQLPSYFETLNIDFRYQLTVMGQFAQAIVLEEVTNNQFKIKTDKPNVKVSWQVTGVRNDEFARAHRVVPEVDKKGTEKGKYLHPDLFGFGKEMQIVPDGIEGKKGNK